MRQKPCFIRFQGVDLFYLDFKNIESEEVAQYLEESKALISKCPPDSILFLVDATGVNYSPKMIREFTNFSRFNGPFARATAIIGISNQIRLLYNVALSIAGRDKSKFKYFSERDDGEAKLWLKSMINNKKGEK